MSKLYDELDFRRAVLAHQYADPLVSFFSINVGFKSIGVEDGDLSLYDNLLDPKGIYLTGTTTTISPAAIALPTNYASLVSFDPSLWLNFWIPLVNNAYQNLYGIYPNLLTAADILSLNYIFTGTFAPPL